MSDDRANFYALALKVLTEADPQKKVALSLDSYSQSEPPDSNPRKLFAPQRPARPPHPLLRSPKEMPKRSTGAKGHIALVHALAHIELNAIDLAWDIVLRFGPSVDRDEFCQDWGNVAKEEALHFQLLSHRLEDLGCAYGDLPAHDGLWEAAEKTSSSLLDRLAVIPMMLEARGIDTSPPLIEKLANAGLEPTARLLETIYNDEIKHLAIGVKWFERLCAEEKLDSVVTWQSSVRRHLQTGPKEPINAKARLKAGMKADYWETFSSSEYS